MPNPGKVPLDDCSRCVGGFCIYRAKAQILRLDGNPQPRRGSVKALKRLTEEEVLALVAKIGPAAAQDLACDVVQGRTCPHLPQYNPVTRELFCDGVFVRRFAAQAKKQSDIIKMFHELGWPRWIEDPHGDRDKPGFERNLHGEVGKLNSCQETRMIRYSCLGKDRIVFWNFIG